MDTERSAFSVDSAAGASVSEKRMVSNYCLCDVYDSIRTIRGGNRGGGGVLWVRTPLLGTPKLQKEKQMLCAGGRMQCILVLNS